QAAFHEGFADIVAVLSMFSLPDVVDAGLDLASGGRSNLISSELLERDALKQSVLFGMAEQMGRELSGIRGEPVRRADSLLPGKAYMSTQLYPELSEPHRRGELLVAAFLNAALDIWLARLAKIGPVAPRKKDRAS